MNFYLTVPLIITLTTYRLWNEVYCCGEDRHITIDFNRGLDSSRWISIEIWYGSDKFKGVFVFFTEAKDFPLYLTFVFIQFVDVV